MVLASSPPAEAVPAEPWLARLRRILRIAETGVVVLVEGPQERLGDLVRHVVSSWPAAEVLVRAEGLASLPPGSTAVLCLREQDFERLNGTRPVVRGHRVVLFGDEPTVTALSQRAFDFYDWISHRIEAPRGPPRFAVRALRAAACARAARVVWGGGDLEGTFSAALPGRTLEYISVAQPYSDLVDALRPRNRAWIALQHLDIDLWSLRARWALAEAGRYGRTLLVQPRSVMSGEPIVHAMTMPIEAAAEVLSRAGAARPGRLAALLDGEPEAIERAAEMARGGASDDAIEKALLTGGERHASIEVRVGRRLPDWPERVEAAIRAEDMEVADRWASAWRARNGGPIAAAAMATVRALQGRGEEARALADEATAAAPEDPGVFAAVRRALALVHLQEQDLPATLAVLDPAEPTGVPAGLASELRDLRTLALARLGRTDQAGRELASALGTDDPAPETLARAPTLAIAWAELERARGNAAKATDRLLRAASLRRDTGSGVHLFQVALVDLLLASGRPAEAGQRARELLAQCQRTGRETASARLLLGRALLDLGRFMDAKPQLRDFLAARPRDRRAGEARLLLAAALTRQGRLRDAVRHLRLGLRVYEQLGDVPGQARAQAELARTQARRGVPRAADEARRALRLADVSPEALPGALRAELETIAAAAPRPSRG